MSNEKALNCDSHCCVRNLVLLYEGEEFRKYLEHHVYNYHLYNQDVSITLQEVRSSSSYPSSNVFEHDSVPQGGGLLDHINSIADEGSSSSPPWDGVVFPAHMTGALEESNQLWDWNDYLLQQQDAENTSDDSGVNIEWMDIQPFFRMQARQVDEESTEEASASFLLLRSTIHRNTIVVKRRTLYAPLDGDVMSLYYQKELFEIHQIQVPRTWDEYRDAATFFHGKPWGPNNTTLAGSCVARNRIQSGDNGDNTHAFSTSLVLSTMTQIKGTSSGFLLDPETIEPILGDAMEETLRILAQQSALSESNDYEVENDSYSNALNDHPGLASRLNEGSCAMTYSWTNQLTTATNNDFEELNNIGVAPTPGSKVVLNRMTGHLETCTPELCPYGTYYDDIGIVNQPSYSAFGGWVGGVSNHSTFTKQHDMADFFSYVSNPKQSLSDVLPNERSNFVSPYRYSDTAASSWVGAGLDEVTALQYTETIKRVNSENTAVEIRISPGKVIRKIIDQEVKAYLANSDGFKNMPLEASDSFEHTALRSEITANMDLRIRDAVASLDSQTTIKNYQSSLRFPKNYEEISMNYIDTHYRETGWGVAALICFSSIAMIVWILWHRKNPAMQAFQPILLIQGVIGLVFMGATLIPLGFDDSLFSKEILDITCMATPFIYVFGYTVFFSSICAKIQVCTEIFKNPGMYERMIVRPIDSLKLFCKLFTLNGVLLFLWAIIDPLKWTRTEKVIYGSIFPDGTIESYGSCSSERFKYPAFAIALFVFNLVFTFVAMLQAFRCRSLVFEYREMQWLQLSILPFFEAWMIGGPVIRVLNEQPTALYVALLMIISSSTIAAAFAILAPKEWYVRKNELMANEMKSKTRLIPAQAGVRVLKHPKLESQKHVSNLQNRLVRYTSSNTELAIDIRVLQEKMRLLTKKEKYAGVGGVFASEITASQRLRMSATMVDDDEPSISGTRFSGFASLNESRDSMNRITTIAAKNHLTARFSELSIDLDDLNDLRAEEGLLDSRSQSYDHDLSAGKTLKIIDSPLGRSMSSKKKISLKTWEEVPAEPPTNKQTQNNDLCQGSGASINRTSDIMQVAADPLGDSFMKEVKEKENSFKSEPKSAGPQHSPSCSSNESERLSGEVKVGVAKISPSSSMDGDTVLSDDNKDITFGNTQADGLSDEMKNLNKMIESDNFRDLQLETMMIAEEFKMNAFLLEDLSGVQSCIDEEVGEDLNQIMELDDIRDLQSKNMDLAEENKVNSSMIKTISHLQRISEQAGDNSRDDGFHTLDVSNATATSTSSAVTENYSNNFPVPTDAPIEPFSANKRDSPEPMAIASAGESSGDNILIFKNTDANKKEGNSKQQLAGEPSGDFRSPLNSNQDIVAEKIDDTTSTNASGHEPSQKPTTGCASFRSSISSTYSIPEGSETHFNRSQSSNNSKSNSISINGWKPAGRMGCLLADVSDSTSASSRAESMTDSVASLEIVSSPGKSRGRIAKDVEQLLMSQLLNFHGFDTVKVGAEKRGEDATDEKKESRAKNISTSRQKKRELEALRDSFGSLGS